MNKTSILSSLDGEERILISHIMDIAKRSEKSGVVMYTPFLNPREANLVRMYCKGDYLIESYGGYDTAERVMIAFVPSQNEPSYPVSAIKVTSKDGKVMSHRDYLGAILSLGIKREKIGDIITDESFAVVFCDNSVAEYVCLNLDKVASVHVSCEVIDENDFSYERKYIEKNVTVASLRLDCVLSAATGRSREDSAELINRGYVKLNYDVAKSTSAKVKTGDVISARGYGKMLVETDCETTRKGRIKICLKQFA